MKNLLLILLCFPLLLFSQENQKRVALVIGNSAYPSAPLDNPINDVRSIEKTLTQVGFEVIRKENLQNSEDFMNALFDFSEKLMSADVGFFYYAGHGIEIGNTNYLVPTSVDFNKYDNPDRRELYVKGKSFDILELMNHLYYEQKNKLSIIVLDACRVPIINVRGGAKEPAINNNSVRVNSGTLLAFSTRSGEVAEDGVGDNSIYCESLCEEMLIPDQNIYQVFGNVRQMVEHKTSNRQNPIERNALPASASGFRFVEGEEESTINIAKFLFSAEKIRNDAESKTGSEKRELYQSALDQYIILEKVLSSSINLEKVHQDPGKKFEYEYFVLRDVYISMGEIYIMLQKFDLQDANKFYEENKDSWNERLYYEYIQIFQMSQIKAVESFESAKLLFEATGEGDDLISLIGLDSQEELEKYSEVFYKYLRSKSYIDYQKGDIDANTLISEINYLIGFNEKEFGKNDYRTACSYYLKGIFMHSSDPLEAYKSLIKSQQIFSKRKEYTRGYYDAEILNYSMTLNPMYPYKWSIMTFNDLLNGSFNENKIVDKDKALKVSEYLRSHIHTNVDSLYYIHVKIIEDALKIAEKDDTDIEGMLLAAKSFAHTFPIIFNQTNEIDYDTYKNSAYSAIRYRNLHTQYDPDDLYSEFLNSFNNVITYSNLYYAYKDKVNSDTLLRWNTLMLDLNNKCIRVCHEHNYLPGLLASINQYLDSYRYLRYDYESLYSYKDLKNNLNLVDHSFDDLISYYKKEDTPDDLTEYIDKMSYFVENNHLEAVELESYNKLKSIYDILFPG